MNRAHLVPIAVPFAAGIVASNHNDGLLVLSLCVAATFLQRPVPINLRLNVLAAVRLEYSKHSFARMPARQRPTPGRLALRRPVCQRSAASLATIGVVRLYAMFGDSAADAGSHRSSEFA